MGFLYSQLFVTPQAPSKPLIGQTLVVTGSNTGLGYTAAQHIARLKPSHLILAVRNVSKGNAARDSIIASIPDMSSSATKIEVWPLDLSNFVSVLSFADRCTTDLDRIDGVSLNAGIQTGKFELFENYESTLTVNVISTYLLAIALLPKLCESARKHAIAPRLSIVSSETHAWADVSEMSAPVGESVLKVMSDPANQISRKRYMTTKLMQILIFRHIHSLLVAKGDNSVIWNILNPGFCYSELARDASLRERVKLSILRFFLARSPEVGGRPIAAGLVAGKESDGKYMHDGVADEHELSAYVKSAEGAAMGKQLWEELKVIFEGLRPGLAKGL